MSWIKTLRLKESLVFVFCWFLAARSEAGEFCFHHLAKIDGVCTPLINCKYAFYGVLNHVEPQVCKLGQTSPIVCCPIDAPAISERASSISTHHECLEYSKSIKSDTCPIHLGKLKRSRSKVVRGQFPHVGNIIDYYTHVTLTMHILIVKVALISDNKTGRDIIIAAAIHFGRSKKSKSQNYVCFGSLISERFVISPAYCAPPEGSRLADYEVHLGVSSKKIQRRSIADVYTHPDVADYDVALLKLKRDAKFSRSVRPICLGDDTSWESRLPVLAGWKDKNLTMGPWEMRRARVDRVDCGEFYSVEGSLDEGSQICATVRGGDMYAPGSSLLIESEDDCTYTLIGIKIFLGIEEDDPILFTRVRHFQSWIEDVVWSEVLPDSLSYDNLDTKGPLYF